MVLRFVNVKIPVFLHSGTDALPLFPDMVPRKSSGEEQPDGDRRMS